MCTPESTSLKKADTTQNFLLEMEVQVCHTFRYELFYYYFVPHIHQSKCGLTLTRTQMAPFWDLGNFATY